MDNISLEKAAILKGEKAKLKEYLIQALNECGWTDKVRLICRETIVAQQNGLTVDQLIDKVTPQARASIPDKIKEKMILKIKKTFLEIES